MWTWNTENPEAKQIEVGTAQAVPNLESFFTPNRGNSLQNWAINWCIVHDIPIIIPSFSNLHPFIPLWLGFHVSHKEGMTYTFLTVWLPGPSSCWSLTHSQVDGNVVRCPNLCNDFVNVLTREPIRSGIHYFEFVMHKIGDEQFPGEKREASADGGWGVRVS